MNGTFALTFVHISIFHQALTLEFSSKTKYNAMTSKQRLYFYTLPALQMDKATLLARVVEQVKLLKREASEATTQSTTLPPETDEVSIELNTGADRVIYIRASISCDDRPDLVAGLAQAFHGLRLRTVRADMTSLGGRARHVFILCKDEGRGAAGVGANASLRSLEEAVRQALARVASPETAYGSRPFQSKRQRILESHYSIMSI